MREIKFCGKRLDGERVYGDLIHSFNHVYVGTENKFLKECRVDPESVGQYTGLHDKNGKEIYEGDIVRVFGTEEFGPTELDVDEKCVVRYNNETAGFYCDVIHKRTVSVPLDCPAIYEYDTFPLYRATDEDMHSFEVIGNIHDSPKEVPADDR
jgi:uncharacterized phage protein (TIGR01671 family)